MNRWIACALALGACGSRPATPIASTEEAASEAPSREASSEAAPLLSDITLPNVCSDYEPFIRYEEGEGSYETASEDLRGVSWLIAFEDADLYGDGQPERLALIACARSGGGLWAFALHEGEWETIDGIPGGVDEEDGLAPSFRVEGAEVIVQRASCREPDDENEACAPYVVEERWRLSEDRFTRAFVGPPTER